MNEEAAGSVQRSSVGNFFSASLNRISSLSSINIPPFFKKKSILAGSAILLVIIILIIINSFGSEDLNVPTYTAKKGNFLVSITESGELRAKNSVSITAPRIRSTLKLVYLVPEGTYVKANDVVVKFDPTEALNNLKEAESKLELAISDREKLNAQHRSTEAQMESDLKSAELTYELSRLSLEQMKFEAAAKQQEAKLQHQKNELSFQKTTKDIESKKIILQSEKNRTEIEIRQRRQDLERAQNDLNMLTLTAPKDGLVVYEPNWNNSGRKFSVGDNTWPGNTVATLPDLSSMESVTYVNEVDVSNVRKGQTVEVKLDAFQDSAFQGSINDVASLGKTKDNNSPVKVFEILVGIKSRSSILKPGMTTSNKIIISQIPNVISVPLEAVFDKDGKKVVYVKSGSDFDETVVQTGQKSEDFIIITKGLKDGDVVSLKDPNEMPEEAEELQSNQKPMSMPRAGK